MKLLNLSAYLVAAAALAACGGGGGGATPGENGTVEIEEAKLPAGKDCGNPNLPQEIFASINEARAQARSCGSQQFEAAQAISYWNTKLADASIRHSTDMANNQFFGHTGSDGSSPEDRVGATDYGSGGAGEIAAVVFGEFSAEKTMPDWLRSEGHCVVIMGTRKAEEIGASCVKGDDGGSYVTVDFGDGLPALDPR